MLRWAYSDIEKLAALDQAVHQTEPEMAIDPDPDTGHKTYKLVVGNILSDDAERWANQAIANLRHGLDQAVCAAWECAKLGDPPKALYYPIRNSFADLKGTLAKAPYCQFGEHFQTAIKAMHPYPARDGDPGNAAFVALSKAAQKKHRVVCKVLGKVQSVNISNGMFYNMVSNPIAIPTWDIEKGEIILGTTTADGHMHLDIKLELNITSGGAGPLDGTPLVPNLVAIHQDCQVAIFLLAKAASLA